MEVVFNSQTFLFKTSYNWEKTLRYLSVWNIEDKMIGNFWHIHAIHAIWDNDVWNTKVLLYYNNLENNTIFKLVFWVHNINNVMGHLFGWL